MTVAFHGPAFSETEKDFAAMDILLDLTFGETSDLYKRLVETEQKVDQLFADSGANADPSLVTVYARVKKLEDAVYVRDQILRAFEAAVAAPPDARRLADAKSNARYSFARRLDNTETIAATLARFVRYSRSYETLNHLLPRVRLADARRPAGRREDLLHRREPGRHDALEGADAGRDDDAPGARDARPGDARCRLRPRDSSVQKTSLPQLNVKLLFTVGSAYDPTGKEGLSALAAAMIAEAGSKELRIDEINKALYPMAASFADQVDKEMTTFTGRVHRDNWKAFFDTILPQLLDPGFRAEDFQRLKDATGRTRSSKDLRSNNEEELGKERLQTNLFAGTPYGHPVLGTVAGIQAITPLGRPGLRPEGLHAKGPDGRRRRGRARGDARPPEGRARAGSPTGRRCRRRRASSRGGLRGCRSRSSRRTRAPRRSRSATRSPSRAPPPTSPPCGWRGRGWASTALRSRTSTSASARSAA